MSQLLKLLLATAFFNALSWTVLIPLWQYPDEQAHFSQVQDFAELSQVPAYQPDTSYEIDLSEQVLGTQRDQFGNNQFTYHPEYKINYSDSFRGPREKDIISLSVSARTKLVKKEATLNPPLYYFIGSVFYKLFYNQDLFTRVYAVRLMSLIFFTATVVVAFKIGRLIFEKNKYLSIALTALVAFNPMLVFSSTGVLPDTLTNLLFALVLFYSLKILKEGISLKVLIAVFLLIILGSLTRQQFLIALPIILLGIIYQLAKNREHAKRWIKLLLGSGVVLIVLSYFSPQLSFIKNFTAPEIEKPNLALLFNPQFLEHIVWTMRHTIAEVLPWYWGVYKWLSLTLPPFSYQVINRILIITAIGLLVRFVLILKGKKFTQFDLVLIFMITASLVYFGILLVWDYFFRLKYNFSFGIQGRYFFPMIVAHLAIITIGLWTIFELLLRKYAKYGLFLTVLLMIVFNDFSLFYVSSSYYEISNIDTFIKQVSQYKPIFLKGNLILIILFTSLVLQSAFLFSFAKILVKSNEKQIDS